MLEVRHLQPVADDELAEGQALHPGPVADRDGQAVKPGQKGRTYTFAALARSAGEPVKLDLQIERRGEPYDRAARGEAWFEEASLQLMRLK